MYLDQTFIWERRRDLTDTHFKTAIEDNAPFCYPIFDRNGTISGAEGLYIDIFHLFKQVMNFTYDIALPPDRAYGTLKNGKWNGKTWRFLHEKFIAIFFVRVDKDAEG